ncbi:phosphatase PAP2 family protein [Bacillus sp. AK031]
MDDKIFWAVNSFSKRSSLLNHLMIFISNKARYVYLFILLLLLFKNRRTVIDALVSSGASLVVSSIIKLFFFRPRPFVKNRVGILIPSKRNSSFPSKHTLLVFAVSTAVHLRHKVLGKVLSWLSLLTGISRIWTGLHYPSDIFGSAAIGSGISCLTHTFLKYSRQED